MRTKTVTPGKERGDPSLSDFSQCHVDIISHLMTFSGLPALSGLMAGARQIAEDALVFFRDTVSEHHDDEERKLFPAVLASAAKGEELEWVQSMVARLTLEHRQIEATWAKLEPELMKIASGKTSNLDASQIEALVLDYGAHAAYEEAEFLPLCRTILGQNSAPTSQALAFHMPLVPPPVEHI